MKGAFKSIGVELLGDKYVPPHLRRVYPAAFSLFIAIFGITIYPGSGIAGVVPGLILDAAGTAVMTLLFLGWLLDKRVFTEHGFWISAGYWTTALVYTLFSIRDWEFLTFTAAVCLAFMNLSIGSWVLMRKDPQ